MKKYISDDDALEYTKQGFVLKKNYLPEDVIDKLIAEIESMDLSLPGVVLEDDGETPRAMQGSHLYNDVLKRACQYTPLLSGAKKLISDNLYLHQFRVNFKQAFCGGAWPWHQDMPFWKKLDNIPEPKLVNVLIFLDDVNEFNGPLIVVPKSHCLGDVENVEHSGEESDTSESWREGFANKALKYQISKDIVSEVSKKNGMVSNKGKRGTVLFFSPEIFHYSGPNCSPNQRRVMILTYNDVNNRPREKGSRPEFIASTDYEPMVEVNEF